MDRRTEVLVVGSGAGGTVTAHCLAAAGFEVTVLEEGGRVTPDQYGRSSPEAMRLMYRMQGMNPISGRVPIGYVEGACLGGSTEINCGFWHRTPAAVLSRWKNEYELTEIAEQDLEPHFAWGEEKLGVALFPGPWPRSTELFARGIEAMGWSFREVPRGAPGCQQSNRCAQGCPTGAKQGMTRKLIPEAEGCGARFVTNARVLRLDTSGDRVRGAVVLTRDATGATNRERIQADHVFVCAGATETPALLLRSGIRHGIGNSFRIHPYLKVVARYPEPVGAIHNVLPLLQVDEFSPEIVLGGGYNSLGQLAMTLTDQGLAAHALMARPEHLSSYYAGVRGSGLGRVRALRGDAPGTSIRYQLTRKDLQNLSLGLARLAQALLAGGAEEVIPSVWGVGPIRSATEAASWLTRQLPRSALNLVTVHAFSSCPLGGRRSHSAADPFGRVWGYENLFLNDASMLPDSPGVNPQGTIIALARQNALHFVDSASP